MKFKASKHKILMAVTLVGSFMLTSCGLFSRDKEVPWSSSYAEPWWFNFPGREVFNEMGKTKTHLFFDFAPYININERTLNFVPLTPVGSRAAYQIDIPSGVRYRSHFYCSQNDIWERYSGEIQKPPFTLGVVPRMLDQVGRPQQIFVFGRNEFYRQDHGEMSHRVRVVGGVVEEKCFSGNCVHTNNWEKRLVLLAVDPNDPAMKSIKSIDHLKDQVDWEEAIAFMQNSKGRNFYKGEEFPGYRVVGEIQAGFALRFALGRSHMFKRTELKKIRSACYKLYDYAWDYMVNYDQIKKAQVQESLEELDEKIGRQFALKKQVQNLIRARTGNSPASNNFAYRFRVFAEEYGKKFQTCTDFVRPNDINLDPEKSWFFVFVTGFYKMLRLGHYYHCTRNSWYDNLTTSEGKLYKDPIQMLKNCTESELNRAFDGIPRYLEKIRRKDAPVMRFVEYDNGSGGTHSKLYTWVIEDHKRQKCSGDEKKLQKANQSFRIFPEDVRWQKVYSKRKNKKLMDVIY
jgi:hypothetical protein